MGQEVRSGRNSFMMLFRTACDLKNKKIRDIISVPQSGVGLPVINMPSLYIRESYRNLYEYIGKNFADSPPWTTNLITVTGTSGIGKSAFLVYFTIRLLAESNDDNPPIIIFHAKGGDSECYAFGGKTTFRAGSIIDFADLLTLPETWYLADSVSHPWLRTAKTIIAVSPKTLNSGANDYQEVTKTTPIIYYMEPWMLDELELCRSKIFTVVPKDFMEELYNMIGGVPRYVLQAAATVLVRDPNNRDGAVKGACSRVNKAIDEVKKPSGERIFGVQQPSAPPLASSSRSHNISPRMGVKPHPRGNPQSAGCPGMGGSIERSGQRAQKSQPQGTSLDLSQYDKQREGTKKNKKTQKTEKLLLPSNPNHPCVDLVLTPDNMFQVTVSSQHPIKQNPLKNIVDKIPNSDRKSRLYFIVPADVYTNFRLQNYETEDGKVAKNVPKAITDRVEQWALKFDLRTAAIGKSPGVGNGAPY
ncbi:hypothetical protein BC936DRAFT_145547 [Jimgerdemannia flammicorona]|uniref:Crinkler (CRN) family protein n=1 Tax=Jimgerdemannia flammicorona TaxID=994334 RepID=A0A433D9R4_9FUNG|nr:hypothetical protein BC936DRAFT_145547 [Jimgerdemannia flammicorona]